MRARSLGVVVLFAGASSASLLLACDELECGYGGPGCSPPGLRGACGGAIVLEAPTDVTFTYFDDTGAHEATVTSLSIDPSVIESARVEGSTGRFVLTAHSEGPTMLSVGIEGWRETQAFPITVGAAPRCVDAASSDAGCECGVIRGFALTR